MNDIYYCNLIAKQYEKNIAKHGEQVGGLMKMVLAEEIGELAKACLELRWGGNPDRVREEAVDCLAVVLVMPERENRMALFNRYVRGEAETGPLDPETAFLRDLSTENIFGILRWVDVTFPRAEALQDDSYKSFKIES